MLTIDKQGKLQKEIQKYELKSQEETYLIKGKLQEKDEQIKSLTDQFSSMKTMVEKLVSGLSETKNQQQVNVIAHSSFTSGIMKEKES